MMPTLSMAFSRRGALRRAGIALALLAAAAGARADCWDEAGARFNIDPLLLYSIARVESSLAVDAINRNRDGSYDLGLMQINSVHLPRLKKDGITKERLLSEPCTSVMTGAQILSDFIARHGYTWEAVGAYNAGSAPARRALRQRYADKVWREYQRAKKADTPAASAGQSASKGG